MNDSLRKPAIMATQYSLPFTQLDPRRFEDLCASTSAITMMARRWLLQFIRGLDNIRDVIPFPRYPGNADF